MLAKGLGRALAPPDRALSTHEDAARASIPFAHARKPRKDADVNEEAAFTCATPAYSQLPFTPRNQRRQKQDALSSSARSRSSRASVVLNELDISEREYCTLHKRLAVLTIFF